MPQRSEIINFGAGPSTLPEDVLHEAAKGLLNYNQTGIGLTELSHRSKEFADLTRHLESLIREQLAVPTTHVVLFTQGGGSAQFSAVVLNLLAWHRIHHPDVADGERVMDYVVTGSWSKKAAEEARRLGGAVNIAVDARKTSTDGKSFDRIPPADQWKLSPSPNAAFVYYCDNETVDGVQFSHDPTSLTSFPFHVLPPNVPLVADYSSSFMSRPIPRLADHALIYAGAQKNIGPSGLTILIVRKDLLVDTDAAVPLGATPVPYTLAYKTLADSGSLYNTPPMFPMYVADLVLAHFAANGGLQRLETVNRHKSEMLYAALEIGEKMGLIKLKVQSGSRSWMNVTFQVLGEVAEQQFLDEAEARGFRQLKGHRSVGGIRVSLYNAVTEVQVEQLVKYIKEFYASQRVEGGEGNHAV